MFNVPHLLEVTVCFVVWGESPGYRLFSTAYSWGDSGSSEYIFSNGNWDDKPK